MGQEGGAAMNLYPTVRDPLVLSPTVRSSTAMRSPTTPATFVSTSHALDIQMEENEVEDDDYEGVEDEEEDEDYDGVDTDGPSTVSGEGRKFRSKAWREYVPVYDDGVVTKGECKHCSTHIGAKRGAGTSGLRNHLKRCKVRHEALGVLSQLNATLMSPDGVGLGSWSFDAAVSRRELVKMIVLHEFPFSVVDYEGFRKFVSSLNLAFKMISRRTLKNDCLKAFEEQKRTLKEVFNNSRSRISLTMDMWTSNQTLGYMCITSHYIDDSWKIKKRIIKFAVLETPHTGIAMYNAILRCIQDWKCEDKIFAITLDNAASNGAMVKLLKQNLLAKNMLLGKGKLLHQRCAAHVLNLVCQAGLNFLDPIIAKIRDSVKYIRGSQARHDRFEEIIKQQGITYGKSLNLDVATRWNSTFLMLDTAMHYKSVFHSLGIQDAQYTYAPTFEDWERVEVVCRLLKVFHEATNVISGSKYPTSNLYFHEIWKAKLRLEIEGSEVDSGIFGMVQCMRKKFKKYWKLSWMTLSIPVILDPQFKYPFLEFRFQQAFGDNATSRIAKVKKVFKELFSEYAQINNSQSTQQGCIDVDMGIDDNDPLADWDRHLSYRASSSNLVPSELDTYMAKPPIPRSDKFDILSWWQMNSLEYPILARMARDILAAPASTVASESAFSTGHRVVSDFRSRLTPETVESLICLQDWFRESGSSELRTESIYDIHGPEDLPI